MPKLRKHVGSNEDLAIAARLREARIHRGLKQVEMAELLKVDQSLVSDYERGIIRVHGALLAKFAKALKLSADELLGLKTPRRNGVIHDAQLARRVARLGQLGKRDRQALLRNIDHFLKGAGIPD